MSQVCKILRWSCAFIISVAIAQLIQLLPWSLAIVGTIAFISYIIGKQQNSYLLQIIAFGLIVGWIKGWHGG